MENSTAENPTVHWDYTMFKNACKPPTRAAQTETSPEELLRPAVDVSNEYTVVGESSESKEYRFVDAEPDGEEQLEHTSLDEMIADTILTPTPTESENALFAELLAKSMRPQRFVEVLAGETGPVAAELQAESSWREVISPKLLAAAKSGETSYSLAGERVDNAMVQIFRREGLLVTRPYINGPLTVSWIHRTMIE
jgi:hypothetical protein